MTADSPRPPARRGKARSLQREETRARLIDATVELLRANSLMELAATDIAGRAGLSNAAFYVYFRDVYDAVLAACAHAEQVSPDLLALLERTGAVQHDYVDITPRWHEDYSNSVVHTLLSALGFRRGRRDASARV